MPNLSIVIVNWNTRNLLVQCIQSLYKNINNLSFDIWVVDNASADNSVDAIRKTFPKVNLIANSENEGFARANNKAMHSSRGYYMLLLNSDTIVTPGAIQALLKLGHTQPRAGIVGAQLINNDGSFQASHSPFPNLHQEFLILTGLGRWILGPSFPSRGPDEDKGPQRADYVEGACMLVRRQAFEQVGGMDEDYFMYSEEVDWCYSMKKNGWQVWYQPSARIIHHRGGSNRGGGFQFEANLYRSRVRFFRKHYGNIAATALKMLIYGITTAKFWGHGILRFVSRGRYGRKVIDIHSLTHSLKGV